MSNLEATNLLELSGAMDGQKLKAVISGFSCPKNPDIERFLKENSLDFSRQGLAATYLVFSPMGGTMRDKLKNPLRLEGETVVLEEISPKYFPYVINANRDYGRGTVKDRHRDESQEQYRARGKRDLCRRDGA